MEASADSVPVTGPHGRQDVPLPQVFGRYLLVQRLSRGGMGEIFLAKHGLAGFEKLAVIKKVLPHLAADAQFISRFVDEAQVAIKLQHVNVAQVFEVGRVGDEYFLALEYIEGRDLRRTIGILASKRKRLPVDLALFIGRELANGLAYAHRRTANDGSSLNLVHCDISPPNVLVSFEGETKVIDFGIAKSAIRGTATDPKMGFGKFGYMAPEQLIRGGIVDHRTDIYAAGVVLFELLTGTRLYEAGQEPDYRALARKVSKGEHMLPSEIEPTLAPYDDLVATALRPRPEDRYQSAAELRDAIQQSLVGINPTISTDQLGAFMRELFADEMLQQKELHERIAHTHIADFQAQLHTQSISTVSFALASGALVADATATTPAVPRARVSGRQKAQTVPPRAPSVPPAGAAPSPDEPVTSLATDDLSLADGTGTASRISLELPAAAPPTSRKRVALIAGLAFAASVAVALAAWVATHDGTHAPAVVAASGAGAAGAGQAVTAVPIEIAPTHVATPGPVAPAPAGSDAVTQPVIEIDPQPAPGSAQAVAVPPAHGPPPSPHHPRTVPHDPRAVAAVEHPAPVASGTTRVAVGAKFSAASREYEIFKGKNGLRLDREWNELTMFVQFKLNDSNLDDGMHRIEAFRAKLHE